MIKEKDSTFVSVLARSWPVLLVAAMVAVFALVMFVGLGQSIWFDEGYSLQLAKRPVGELLALTAVDAHPPLYYLLLKAWAGIFGWSEWALRALGATLAALTIPAVYLLVRKLFTVRLAVAILPLMVLAPFFLRYGYELRMYALAGLIGVLATLALVYARSSNKKSHWLVYAALVALGMYTLYMMIAVWIAHVVWLLIEDVRAKKNILKQPWVYAFVGAVLLFAAYIPTFFYQFTHSALPGVGYQVTLTKVVDIVTMLFLYTPDWKVNALISLALGVYIVALVRSLIHVYQKTEYKKSLRIVIVMAVVPIMFFMLLSLSPDPVYINRYLAHVIVFFYLLVAVTVGLYWRVGSRPRAVALTIATIAVLAFGVVQLKTTGNLNFERLQLPMTSSLSKAVDCNNSITVADDPYTYIDSAYYFENCNFRFFSQNPVEKKGGYAPLFDSQERVSSSDELSTPILYHLHWDNETGFKPDDRYSLVVSEKFDKQVLDTYVLSEE